MYPTLSPAYGRDYTTAKAAREAFLGGADFVLHSYQGTTYADVNDLRAEYGAVNIRYSGNRKVCVVRIPKEGK